MFKSNESFAMEIQLTLSQKIVETGLSKFTDSVFCSQRRFEHECYSKEDLQVTKLFLVYLFLISRW